MRWFLAGGALVGIALGCGGLVDKPVAVPTTPVTPTVVTPPPVTPPPTETKTETATPPGPSTARPLTLLLLKPAASECEFVLLALPSLKETRLGGPVDCSYEQRIVLDAAGKRALFGRNAVDLVSGAVSALPEAPGCENRESMDAHYDADNKTVIHQSCGEGEPEWMEGPSYPVNHKYVYELKDGAWVERGNFAFGAQPEDQAAKDTFLAMEKTNDTVLQVEGGSVSWVGDEAVKAVLSEAAGSEPDGGWNFFDGNPRVAFATIGMGEGEQSGGPLLVEVDGKWVKLPDFADETFQLNRTGDWLVVGDYDNGDWRIVDLTNRAVVWTGKRALWVWPEGLALPK